MHLGKSNHEHVNQQGQVDSQKYFGVLINNLLKFHDHTTAIYNKADLILYPL